MRNTASRCDELRDTISAILERGTLARKECERLRGRLQFASNQVAGKKAGLAFKVLSRHLRTRQTSVDDELRTALLFLRDRFLEGPPRAPSANVLHLWHVYVDASCDNDWIGLGGVLISDSGARVGYFSEWATAELRQLMGPNSSVLRQRGHTCLHDQRGLQQLSRDAHSGCHSRHHRFSLLCALVRKSQHGIEHRGRPLGGSRGRELWEALRGRCAQHRTVGISSMGIVVC